MKLSVHTLGREVATLEPVGAFKSVMTYHPNVAERDFVSLTMPVRSALLTGMVSETKSLSATFGW